MSAEKNTATPAAPQEEWPTMYMPCPVCGEYTPWNCFEGGAEVGKYRCSICSPPLMNVPLPAPPRVDRPEMAAA